MTSPTVDADLELEHYDGTVIPLVLETVWETVGSGENARRVARPRSIRAALSAANADEPLADWLEPYVQETWIGGCGGGGAKQGYTQAPGVVTRIGSSKQGFAFPGPAENAASYPDVNNSDTPIMAIEEFLGALYFAQAGTSTANQPRVMVAPAGGASLSDSLGGASGTAVAANNAMTDLLVFKHGSAANTRRLYASGVDTTGGRLHYTSNGSVWTSTASGDFGATRFDWLQKVFWKTANGDQAERMVAGDMARNMVSYTKPNVDPALAASWVLDAFPVNTTGTIRRPPTIRRHLYIPAIDNVFDVDELGNTPGIVSDMDRLRHPFNGYASFYMDDYIYFTYMSTIARVYVGEPGLLQTTPGVCGPGAFTEAEHEFNGWATCFTGDQGYLVAATFNPNNGKCGIWWGRDRKYYPEIETANPMVWWGPEIFSEENIFVTAMRTYANITANTLHLWVAAVPYSASGTNFVGGEPIISYFTLPIAGQPLSDFLTGGSNLFAVGATAGPWQPYTRIDSLPYTWQDKGATKFLNDVTIGSRGLDSDGNGTSMNVYTRADPEPGDTTWPSGVGVGTSPTETVSPGTTTQGQKTQYRLDFNSPHGADVLATRAVGVLDAVRITAFRRAPTVRVLDVTVQYGHGIRTLSGGAQFSKSVDDISELLQDITEGDRVTMRIRPNRRYTVLARQVKDDTIEYIGRDERATTRLQLGILGTL